MSNETFDEFEETPEETADEAAEKIEEKIAEIAERVEATAEVSEPKGEVFISPGPNLEPPVDGEDADIEDRASRLLSSLPQVTEVPVENVRPDDRDAEPSREMTSEELNRALDFKERRKRVKVMKERALLAAKRAEDAIHEAERAEEALSKPAKEAVPLHELNRRAKLAHAPITERRRLLKQMEDAIVEAARNPSKYVPEE